MTASAAPRFSIPVRILLCCAALIAGGFIGQMLGEAVGYAIAGIADRDPAGLKDMLIGCMIFGIFTGAAAGVWLVLHATWSHLYARRGALALTIAIALAGVAVTTAGYDRPNGSGHPLVEYELRLPPGLQPPQHEISVVTWHDKSGHGAYIARVGIVG